ncbi:MAG: aminoglycoside phosphotransferase family protein, partial [Lutimonas sp.]
MIGVLREVFEVFLPEKEFDSFIELTSGHINDTFLITTKKQDKYIFQKINKGVFPDVPGLIGNKVKISRHLHKKLLGFSQEERQRKILTFLKTCRGEDYFVDKNGDFWNVTIFIEKSQTFETVT